MGVDVGESVDDASITCSSKMLPSSSLDKRRQHQGRDDDLAVTLSGKVLNAAEKDWSLNSLRRSRREERKIIK